MTTCKKPANEQKVQVKEFTYVKLGTRHGKEFVFEIV